MLNQETLLNGRYLITETLSEGGQRAVYSAEDRQSGSTVILQRYDFSDDARQAFEARAQALTGLSHAALPRVIDFFAEGDSQFVVTEKVEGESLAKVIEARGEPFAGEEVEKWAVELLGALGKLHAEEPPVIHGQIKPENVMLTTDGRALLNWGDSQEEPGAFASPEQARGQDLDARSDIYSLGATLYNLATATAPPDALRRIEAGSNEQLDPLRRANKINSQVPAALSDSITKAMALDPDDRFATAEEMQGAISGEARPAITESERLETTPLAADGKKGQRPWVIGAVVVLLIAAVGIGLFAWQRNEGNDASSLKRVKLNSRDMELLFQEMIPPQAQAQIAKNPEQKKRLVSDVKEFLAVAQQAEAEGYAEKPELQSQLALNTDGILSSAYKKKNPQVTVTDDEINAYHQAHPTAFDDFVNSNPMLQMQMQGPEAEQTKSEFRKQYAEIKVMAERARTDKLDRDDLTRLRLLFERSKVLREAYLKDYAKKLDDEIKPEDVQQYYTAHQGELDEVHARHILLSTEGGTVEEKRRQAQEILTRIRGGEDFAKLASEFSDDPQSKVQGGDVGVIPKGAAPPEFEKAMFALQPGQVSDVVQTEIGFHIIKVDERKPGPSPDADEKARQQITQLMKQERIENRVKEIVASASIDIAENFDTTPKPQPPAPMTLPPGAMPQGQPNQ